MFQPKRSSSVPSPPPEPETLKPAKKAEDGGSLAQLRGYLRGPFTVASEFHTQFRKLHPLTQVAAIFFVVYLVFTIIWLPFFFKVFLPWFVQTFIKHLNWERIGYDEMDFVISRLSVSEAGLEAMTQTGFEAKFKMDFDHTNTWFETFTFDIDLDTATFSSNYGDLFKLTMNGFFVSATHEKGLQIQPEYLGIDILEPEALAEFITRVYADGLPEDFELTLKADVDYKSFGLSSGYFPIEKTFYFGKAVKNAGEVDRIARLLIERLGLAVSTANVDGTLNAFGFDANVGAAFYMPVLDVDLGHIEADVAVNDNEVLTAWIDGFAIQGGENNVTMRLIAAPSANLDTTMLNQVVSELTEDDALFGLRSIRINDKLGEPCAWLNRMAPYFSMRMSDGSALLFGDAPATKARRSDSGLSGLMTRLARRSAAAADEPDTDVAESEALAPMHRLMSLFGLMDITRLAFDVREDGSVFVEPWLRPDTNFPISIKIRTQEIVAHLAAEGNTFITARIPPLSWDMDERTAAPLTMEIVFHADAGTPEAVGRSVQRVFNEERAHGLSINGIQVGGNDEELSTMFNRLMAHLNFPLPISALRLGDDSELTFSRVLAPFQSLDIGRAKLVATDGGFAAALQASFTNGVVPVDINLPWGEASLALDSVWFGDFDLSGFTFLTGENNLDLRVSGLMSKDQTLSSKVHELVHTLTGALEANPEATVDIRGLSFGRSRDSFVSTFSRLGLQVRVELLLEILNLLGEAMEDATAPAQSHAVAAGDSYQSGLDTLLNAIPKFELVKVNSVGVALEAAGLVLNLDATVSSDTSIDLSIPYGVLGFDLPGAGSTVTGTGYDLTYNSESQLLAGTIRIAFDQDTAEARAAVAHLVDSVLKKEDVSIIFRGMTFGQSEHAFVSSLSQILYEVTLPSSALWDIATSDNVDLSGLKLEYLWDELGISLDGVDLETTATGAVADLKFSLTGLLAPIDISLGYARLDVLLADGLLADATIEGLRWVPRADGRITGSIPIALNLVGAEAAANDAFQRLIRYALHGEATELRPGFRGLRFGASRDAHTAILAGIDQSVDLSTGAFEGLGEASNVLEDLVFTIKDAFVAALDTLYLGAVSLSNLEAIATDSGLATVVAADVEFNLPLNVSIGPWAVNVDLNGNNLAAVTGSHLRIAPLELGKGFHLTLPMDMVMDESTKDAFAGIEDAIADAIDGNTDGLQAFTNLALDIHTVLFGPGADGKEEGAVFDVLRSAAVHIDLADIGSELLAGGIPEYEIFDVYAASARIHDKGAILHIEAGVEIDLPLSIIIPYAALAIATPDGPLLDAEVGGLAYDSNKKRLFATINASFSEDAGTKARVNGIIDAIANKQDFDVVASKVSFGLSPAISFNLPSSFSLALTVPVSEVLGQLDGAAAGENTALMNRIKEIYRDMSVEVRAAGLASYPSGVQVGAGAEVAGLTVPLGLTAGYARAELLLDGEAFVTVEVEDFDLSGRPVMVLSAPKIGLGLGAMTPGSEATAKALLARLLGEGEDVATRVKLQNLVFGSGKATANAILSDFTAELDIDTASAVENPLIADFADVLVAAVIDGLKRITVSGVELAGLDAANVADALDAELSLRVRSSVALTMDMADVAFNAILNGKDIAAVETGRLRAATEDGIISLTLPATIRAHLDRAPAAETAIAVDQLVFGPGIRGGAGFACRLLEDLRLSTADLGLEVSADGLVGLLGPLPSLSVLGVSTLDVALTDAGVDLVVAAQIDASIPLALDMAAATLYIDGPAADMLEIQASGLALQDGALTATISVAVAPGTAAQDAIRDAVNAITSLGDLGVRLGVALSHDAAVAPWTLWARHHVALTLPLGDIADALGGLGSINDWLVAMELQSLWADLAVAIHRAKLHTAGTTALVGTSVTVSGVRVPLRLRAGFVSGEITVSGGKLLAFVANDLTLLANDEGDLVLDMGDIAADFAGVAPAADAAFQSWVAYAQGDAATFAAADVGVRGIRFGSTAGGASASLSKVAVSVTVDEAAVTALADGDNVLADFVSTVVGAVWDAVLAVQLSDFSPANLDVVGDAAATVKAAVGFSIKSTCPLDVKIDAGSVNVAFNGVHIAGASATNLSFATAGSLMTAALDATLAAPAANAFAAAPVGLSVAGVRFGAGTPVTLFRGIRLGLEDVSCVQAVLEGTPLPKLALPSVSKLGAKVLQNGADAHASARVTVSGLAASMKLAQFAATVTLPDGTELVSVTASSLNWARNGNLVADVGATLSDTPASRAAIQTVLDNVASGTDFDVVLGNVRFGGAAFWPANHVRVTLPVALAKDLLGGASARVPALEAIWNGLGLTVESVSASDYSHGLRVGASAQVAGLSVPVSIELPYAQIAVDVDGRKMTDVSVAQILLTPPAGSSGAHVFSAQTVGMPLTGAQTDTGLAALAAYVLDGKATSVRVYNLRFGASSAQASGALSGLELVFDLDSTTFGGPVTNTLQHFVSKLAGAVNTAVGAVAIEEVSVQKLHATTLTDGFNASLVARVKSNVAATFDLGGLGFRAAYEGADVATIEVGRATGTSAGGYITLTAPAKVVARAPRAVRAAETGLVLDEITLAGTSFTMNALKSRTFALGSAAAGSLLNLSNIAPVLNSVGTLGVTAANGGVMTINTAANVGWGIDLNLDVPYLSLPVHVDGVGVITIAGTQLKVNSQTKALSGTFTATLPSTASVQDKLVALYNAASAGSGSFRMALGAQFGPAAASSWQLWPAQHAATTVNFAAGSSLLDDVLDTLNLPRFWQNLGLALSGAALKTQTYGVDAAVELDISGLTLPLVLNIPHAGFDFMLANGKLATVEVNGLSIAAATGGKRKLSLPLTMRLDGAAAAATTAFDQIVAYLAGTRATANPVAGFRNLVWGATSAGASTSLYKLAPSTQLALGTTSAPAAGVLGDLMDRVSAAASAMASAVSLTDVQLASAKLNGLASGVNLVASVSAKASFQLDVDVGAFRARSSLGAGVLSTVSSNAGLKFKTAANGSFTVPINWDMALSTGATATAAENEFARIVNDILGKALDATYVPSAVSSVLKVDTIQFGTSHAALRNTISAFSTSVNLGNGRDAAPGSGLGDLVPMNTSNWDFRVASLTTSALTGGLSANLQLSLSGYSGALLGLAMQYAEFDVAVNGDHLTTIKASAVDATTTATTLSFPVTLGFGTLTTGLQNTLNQVLAIAMGSSTASYDSVPFKVSISNMYFGTSAGSKLPALRGLSVAMSPLAGTGSSNLFAGFKAAFNNLAASFNSFASSLGAESLSISAMSVGLFPASAPLPASLTLPKIKGTMYVNNVYVGGMDLSGFSLDGRTASTTGVTFNTASDNAAATQFANLVYAMLGAWNGGSLNIEIRDMEFGAANGLVTAFKGLRVRLPSSMFAGAISGTTPTSSTVPTKFTASQWVVDMIRNNTGGMTASSSIVQQNSLAVRGSLKNSGLDINISMNSLASSFLDFTATNFQTKVDLRESSGAYTNNFIQISTSGVRLKPGQQTTLVSDVTMTPGHAIYTKIGRELVRSFGMSYNDIIKDFRGATAVIKDVRVGPSNGFTLLRNLLIELPLNLILPNAPTRSADSILGKVLVGLTSGLTWPVSFGPGNFDIDLGEITTNLKTTGLVVGRAALTPVRIKNGTNNTVMPLNRLVLDLSNNSLIEVIKFFIDLLTFNWRRLFRGDLPLTFSGMKFMRGNTEIGKWMTQSLPDLDTNIVGILRNLSNLKGYNTWN